MTLPSTTGMSWVAIRKLAQALAGSQPTDDLAEAAVGELNAAEVQRRMLGVFVLGFTAAARPDNLETLRGRVPPDPNWEVQEALAQAFDACCAARGYESALPAIDAWLADPQPNARRAVSEGLRPWTSKSRDYFARHPAEAIRRLAALRRDSSDYVRHSAGNALRDIRRTHPALVDAETATWILADEREAFTYARVLKAR